jgi:hypothetical protein
MHGVDCVFELRKPPARIQDCRLLVAFCPEWDSYVDALRDAADVIRAHAKNAFVDGWRIEAVHMRLVDEHRMEELIQARNKGFACEWYGTPCRVVEGENTRWFGGPEHG